MSLRKCVSTCACATALALFLVPARVLADVIVVPAGGNLQTALNAARPGDTIQLEPGATYTGNFTLPVHGGTTYVTVRTGGSDAFLPAAGQRITPAHAKYLARIQSPNTAPALATNASAAYWRIALVEFGPNQKGYGDIVALGNGSAAQNSLSLVPHHLIVDRVYVHGDPLHGQKRGIALNSASTTIVNSHVSDIKAIGQDTQTIAGSNGPGPFHIENNYLEGGTEVFLLGGDDPKIPNLVPSDLLFRGNVLTRPIAWRNPIVPTPTGVTATAGSGGTLAAGTYAYRVVARRPAGASTATSVHSAEVTATTTASGKVTIRWTAVPNATEYRVYGRAAGAQNVYWTVTTATFTDTGAAGTAGTPPATGSVWQVKNLFELKNTRRAQVDYNVMENNWKQAQNGMAVLLTVRNQYGGCTWCVVEQITFEYNTVRHVGGGLNVTGIDNVHPSQQTNAIRIRDNEFSDVEKSWGGSGFIVQMNDNPRDITFDHNTFISNGGSGILTVSGPPIQDFVFTNNVARHNSYGIFGASLSYGNNAINYYFPGADIRRNVIAGGKASSYPADNLFPPVTEFAPCFVDYAGGEYDLAPGCPWRGLGTDGKDLGADYAQMRALRSGPSVEPPRVLTVTLPPTVELEAYSAALQETGGTAPFGWSIADGSLPLGLMLDPSSGTISGAASAAGHFDFTVAVTDSRGERGTQPLQLHVDRAIPPVQIVTGSLPQAVATLSYGQHLEATGGLGTYVWTVSSGTLPSGMSLASSGDLGGVPTAAGNWTFTVTVRDGEEPTRAATRTFGLTVLPPPNQAPSVRVTASATGAVAVGAPVVLTAYASDGDGVVRSVEFFVNGQSVGTVAVAPFTLQWTARDGAPHAISARAVDDDGAMTMSAPITVNTTSEIVIYGSDVKTMAGNFQLAADASAANGQRLWNPNKGAAKLAASATPPNYAEFTFYAEAGRAYRVWMRGKADFNSWPNDSIYLQFSGTVDATGAPVYRIGTTGATWYSLEEDSNVGVSGWGWQDNGFGLNVMGPTFYFEKTGLQTLRLQQREDGLSLDQIVISPSKYVTARPGLPKNDATIVPK